MRESFILKGNICYSIHRNQLEVTCGGYLVCVEGKSAGVYQTIPDVYSNLRVTDYGDQLIVPGLVDLHAHAPQFAFRGLGMDLELLNWLETRTFPEESKYKDLEYAKKAYQMYVDEVRKGPVTRAAVFATVHAAGTELLMDLLEDSGLYTLVGKVNMDRNAPEFLREKDAETAARETLQWIESTENKYNHTKPILTPRFIPSCTDELMEKIKHIQKQYNLPIQSHLSENLGEIQWVKELCPNSKFYGDAYYQFGLFGGECKTIMAHCVSSEEDEIELIKKQGVYIAHCPQSNTNLSSGIAPIGNYLELDMKVGLGSDIAGGFSTSIFRAMADAVQCSKLRWRLADQDCKPLTIEEAFYMGTKGGGAFFGKAGSFETGYELDAIVLDDSNLVHPQELTVRERLERLIYLSDDRNVKHKFVQGEKLF